MSSCLRALGLLSVPIAVALTDVSWAFELPTHGAMTAIAVAKSKVTGSPNSSELLRQLGIFDFTTAFGDLYPPFGRRYLDMGGALNARIGQRIEGRVIGDLALMSNLVIPDPYGLGGWIMRGAIREDDNERENGVYAGELHSDEPDGVFNRVFGHFFDPKNDRGLSVAGIAIQPRAVDWALLPGTSVNAPAPRENHFKVTDAREAMWRALTLTRIVAGAQISEGVIPPNGIDGSSDAVRRENTRKAYWATTFRALGDSVHLLQDMAQPQHTRNDWHSGLGCIPGVACALGHASFFEHYLQARTLKVDSFTLKEGFVRPPNASPAILIKMEPLDYDGYGQAPIFNSYAEFFSTATGDNAGKGLANYSNRGFYSFGTNIGSVAGSTYPSPPPSGAGLNTEFLTYPDLKDIAGNVVNGYAKFKTGTVLDSATGIPEDNVKLATVGPWDQFLKEKNANWNDATLNHYNYDDQARLLVPRAVAYSAGFINYFFRGTMQISLPADGVYAVADQYQFSPGNSTSGFTKIKLKLANTTPAIGTGPNAAQDMTGGRLVAVVKFRRMKTTYASDLSGACGTPGTTLDDCRGAVEEILVSTSVMNAAGVPVSSASLVSGATPQEFHFGFSEAIPLNVTDVFLQVVYRGALGTEADAVVVATKDIPEPTYVSRYNTTNATACFNGNWIRLKLDGTVPEPTYSAMVADSLNPATLASQIFSQVSLTFKPPFTSPLSEKGPLVLVNDLAPGQFFRVAVLTEPGAPSAFEIPGYTFYPPGTVGALTNGIDYSSGAANSVTSALLSFRDTNSWDYTFGYRFAGTDCYGNYEWPRDSAAAGGGTFPTPTQVPVSAIAF